MLLAGKDCWMGPHSCGKYTITRPGGQQSESPRRGAASAFLKLVNLVHNKKHTLSVINNALLWIKTIYLQKLSTVVINLDSLTYAFIIRPTAWIKMADSAGCVMVGSSAAHGRRFRSRMTSLLNTKTEAVSYEIIRTVAILPIHLSTSWLKICPLCYDYSFMF